MAEQTETIRVRYIVDDSDLYAAAKAIGLNEDEIKKLEGQVEKLGKEATEAGRKLNNMGDESAKAANKGSGGFGLLGQAAKSAGGLIAGAFAVDKLKEWGGEVIAITGKFQKYEAVLTNAFNGNRTVARAVMAELSSFAARTNYSVDELVAGFVKLKNQGFSPSIAEMTKLADLANSTGKTFDQLSEAIIDAQTGEFERLKEFGIRASKEGDKVTFTFRGVQKQVDFNSQSIQKYILGLGELNGVQGSTAAISKTLEGATSNLGDAWDGFFLSIGKGASGPLAELIGGLTTAIQAASKFIGGTESEAILKQKLEITGLVGSITSLNEKNEVRGRLLQELNAKYPEFLKNLNIESVTNAQLTERLKEVNRQLLGKYLIQQKEEQIQEVLGETAKQYERQQKALEPLLAQMRIMNGFGKQFGVELRNTGDPIADTERNIQTLVRAFATLNQQGKLTTTGAQFPVYLQRLERALNSYKGATDEVNKSERASMELLKAKQDLYKKFGLDENPIPKDDSPTPTAKTKAAKPKDTRDKTKIAELSPLYLFEMLDKLNKEEDDKEKKRRAKQLAETHEYWERRQAIEELGLKRKNELWEKWSEKQKELEGAVFEASVSLINQLFDQSQANKGKELEELQTQKEAELEMAGTNSRKKQEIEIAYAEKDKALKKEQNEIARKQAIFNKTLQAGQILINTAVGISRVVAEVPKFDFGISTGVLIALYAALGAAQLAAVVAQPIPKFAKGVERLNGAGTETSDSIPAMLSRGERVVSAKTNREYFGVLSAIHNTKIPAALLNDFVDSYLKGGSVRLPKAPAENLLPYVLNDNSDVVAALQGLPVQQFNVDGQGFTKHIIKAGRREEDLNAKYSL